MPNIELSNVSFVYTAEENGKKALDKVNLSLAGGEFTSVIGHSGCGKSTLLRLMAGLDLPTEGEVRIDGNTIVEPDVNETIVFQQYPLFPWMKVQKNVVFGIMHSQLHCSKKEAIERAKTFLAKVDLLEYADFYPYQLSGGMKQRVAIARALACDAKVLLMDEPFGALDTRLRTELQRLTEELWLNSSIQKNVVFVTHDINEAILLADRVVFMETGRVKKIIDIPFQRPRIQADLIAKEEYQHLHGLLMQLFYKDEVSCD